MTIPDYIICENCGEKTYPDREPDLTSPWGAFGIYEYKCGCGWNTHVNIGGAITTHLSTLTTSTTREKK